MPTELNQSLSTYSHGILSIISLPAEYINASFMDTNPFRFCHGCRAIPVFLYTVSTYRDPIHF